MLWTIVLREMKEYIKSMKFLIGMMVTVTLIAGATFIGTRDYSQRHQDYLDALPEREGSDIDLLVYRPPEALGILVQGKDRVLGNRASVSEYYISTQTTGYFGWKSRHSLMYDGFAAIDYAFVVRVVMSLFVIFLAYNTISEEKEKGTLRLALANAVPRHIILFGKFIGGLVVILFSLTAATIVALLIMTAHPAVSLGTGDLARIGAIFGVSVIYLTTFFTLSLLVSVLTSRPSTALGILLQIWVVLLLLYPNLAVFIADSSYALPDNRELARRHFEAMRQVGEKRFPYWKNQNMTAEAMYRIDSVYSNELSNQAEYARTLSILSPAALYDETVNRVAKTGIENHDRFIHDLHNYWENNLHYSDAELERAEKQKIDLSGRKYTIPQFTPSSEQLSESILNTLRYTFILTIIGIVFFAGAYTAFLRKDVR